MITTKELLEMAYILKNWDIRMEPDEITKLTNEAKDYADKFGNNRSKQFSKVECLQSSSELPTKGDVGVFYKIKDVGIDMIWDDERERYVRVI